VTNNYTHATLVTFWSNSGLSTEPGSAGTVPKPILHRKKMCLAETIIVFGKNAIDKLVFLQVFTSGGAMFHKNWLHKISGLLVVAGFVLSPTASVWAQATENVVDATVSTEAETDPNNGPAGALDELDLATLEAIAVDDSAIAEPGAGYDVDSFSTHLYLPLVQGSTEANVSAEENVSAANLTFDVCKTQAADATVTLGAISVSATSPNVSYAQHLCKRWIVHVLVPSGGYEFSFNSGNYPTSTVLCNAYRQQWSVYKKGWLQTGFTLVRSGTAKGVWYQGHCNMQIVSGPLLESHLYTPPQVGTDTYRVAIGAYISTTFGPAWQRVIVRADRLLPPR
jgi:hypothetical protein